MAARQTFLTTFFCKSRLLICKVEDDGGDDDDDGGDDGGDGGDDGDDDGDGGGDDGDDGGGEE
eukprot:gene7264-490_t